MASERPIIALFLPSVRRCPRDHAGDAIYIAERLNHIAENVMCVAANFSSALRIQACGDEYRNFGEPKSHQGARNGKVGVINDASAFKFARIRDMLTSVQ